MTNKKSDQKPAKGKPTMAAEPKKPEMPIAPPKQEVQQTAAPTPPATTQRSVFEDYGAAMRQRHWIGRLLKYDKGDYLAAQEDELIPLGTQLAACMDTLSVGWVIWEDGRAIEHHMGLVIDRFKAPPRSALGYLDKNLWALDAMGNPRDPAQFTNYLVVRVPEPEGEVFTFATSSRGGLDAIGGLCTRYGETLLRIHPDHDPIIKLGSDSYAHRDKTIGRVKIPTFEIVGSTPKVKIAA
jgi:hypothetical protein